MSDGNIKKRCNHPCFCTGACEGRTPAQTTYSVERDDEGQAVLPPKKIDWDTMGQDPLFHPETGGRVVKLKSCPKCGSTTPCMAPCPLWGEA